MRSKTKVHGMIGKRNAAKPAEKKITGKGQIMIYAGDLKEQAQAALEPHQSLSDWVRGAIREKLLGRRAMSSTKKSPKPTKTVDASEFF